MATNGHPATPPASDPSARTEAPARPDPEVPLTSAQDDGTAKRPRDARTLHLVLSQLGIHSYQERVPLQLLDFAYRYTNGMLSDSLRLSAEGYTSTERGVRRGGGGAAANSDDSGAVTLTALRQAIASRQAHSFTGPIPKEHMMEEAAERNRVALPKLDKGDRVQLPPEKYCLTGIGWGLNEEWESDEEIVPANGEDAGSSRRQQMMANARESSPARRSGRPDDAMDMDEEEEGAGRMEDVFGESTDGGGDTRMTQD